MKQHRTHTNTKDKENLVKCEENVHFPAKFGKFCKRAIKLRLCRMQKRAVCFLFSSEFSAGLILITFIALHVANFARI